MYQISRPSDNPFSHNFHTKTKQEASPQQKSFSFIQAAQSYVYAKIALLFFLSIYSDVVCQFLGLHDTLPCVLIYHKVTVIYQVSNTSIVAHNSTLNNVVVAIKESFNTKINTPIWFHGMNKDKKKDNCWNPKRHIPLVSLL